MEHTQVGRRDFLTLCSASALVLAAGTPRARAATSDPALVKQLQLIDARQRCGGDWRSMLYMEQKEAGKATVAYEAQVFRRTAEQKFIILFTKPHTSAGQGYLRDDKNLWFYDPAVGKWERRTERERIGGTNSRRSDFDESRLAAEYVPEDGGEEKLGAYQTQVLNLKGKPGVDLAFPILKLWVDKATGNILKRQEFALSGKLLRSGYFPKWTKVYSEAKKDDVWYPEEMRFFDEVEKENQTVIAIKAVETKPLESNVFTKAWLESKAR